MCKGLLKILPAERESVENSLTSIGWRLGPDNSIITDSEKLAEAFFPQGSVHDAYQHIRSICGSATRSLLVVDGYADSSFFTMILAVVLESASIQLLTGPKVPADLILEASMFCQQHPVRKVEIKQRADFHDRFVIVDDRECYHVGASIKDAGKKAFMISRIEDGENIALLLAQYRSSWTAARSIFPP